MLGTKESSQPSSYFHTFILSTKCFEYQVLFDIPEISALMKLTY